MSTATVGTKAQNDVAVHLFDSDKTMLFSAEALDPREGNVL